MQDKGLRSTHGKLYNFGKKEISSFQKYIVFHWCRWSIYFALIMISPICVMTSKFHMLHKYCLREGHSTWCTYHYRQRMSILDNPVTLWGSEEQSRYWLVYTLYCCITITMVDSDLYNICPLQLANGCPSTKIQKRHLKNVLSY